MDEKTKLPKVTVVIPTLNSSQTIQKCLDSLIAQSYPQTEIVVVDARSDDGTATLASKYDRTKVLISEKRSASVQRNTGALYASGDYLFFVDSDFVVPQDIIKNLVHFSIIGNYDAVIINYRPVDATGGFTVKMLEALPQFYMNSPEKMAARFVKRSVFLAIGYNQSLRFNEDLEFQRNLLAHRNRVGIIRGVNLYHLREPKTLREFVTRYVSHAHDFRGHVKSSEGKSFLRQQLLAYFRALPNARERPNIYFMFIPVLEAIRSLSLIIGGLSINDS